VPPEAAHSHVAEKRDTDVLVELNSVQALLRYV
jgi:hypothetical protein